MGMSSIDDLVEPINNKLVKIKLVDLHYQYIPVVTPERMWNNDMSLSISPHVELLTLLNRMKKPNVWVWQTIQNTRYYLERLRRFEIGLTNWTEQHIREHIMKRWMTFCSLRKYGFRKDLYKDRPIRVLEKPFWKTRFGNTPDWVKGMEIWDGGGRCAAAFVLEWDTINVQMVRDRSPNSKDRGAFARKLAHVPGVWSEQEIVCGKS
jgi:hypothetical protein